MKHIITTLITIFICASMHAQITYDSGYYIDNEGKKINCLIRNVGWNDNPESFEIKLDETAEKMTIGLQEAMEVFVPGFWKYNRFTVQMDMSSQDFTNLSTTKSPEFESRTLFLKAIIEGEISLYSYQETTNIRYFFKPQNSDVQQLIYKKYQSDGKTGENAAFRQQLSTSITCDLVEKSEFKNLRYAEKDLVDIIQRNNLCGSEGTVNMPTTKQKQKTAVYFGILAGASTSQIHIRYPSFSQDPPTIDFAEKIIPRVSLFAEVAFPFQRNKWSFVGELSYLAYSDEAKSSVGQDVGITYNAIEIPLGIRYRMFLKSEGSIFLNVFITPTIVTDGQFDVQIFNELTVSSVANWAFGIGYNFNKRFFIEYRYWTDKDILVNHGGWDSPYKSMTLMAGFRLI